MEQNRKIGIACGLFVLSAITLLLFAGTPQIFYWGVPVGITFGFATCVYLANAWDPSLLTPKNSKTKKAGLNLVWVVPLGLLVANLTSYFLDEDIEWVFLGVCFTWIYITFAYMIIQAWRYR